MSSKTCRCCLKLRPCRVQVRLQWQKAGPDGLHRTSRTCRCTDRRTRASSRRTELSSRTTRAEWDNCLSWLSDAHGTKRILSDLYFAPPLHPKLLPVLLLCTGYGCWTSRLGSSECGFFFLTCFHGKLCFWPARSEDASASEQSWPTTPTMQTTVMRLSTRVTWLQVADYHSARWVCDSLSILSLFLRHPNSS